jgi:DNA polymerase III delta prime subunit
MEFPCPHYILYEPLNDSETLKFFSEYKERFGDQCEFEEIDACTTFSSDLFALRFNSWISEIPKKSSSILKIIIVWHSEFLTFACQQMLRRQLEQKSFRNRVWFHIEDPSSLQPSILSRCITKRMPTNIRVPEYKYD